MSDMFLALIAGVFFVLLVWIQRRTRAAKREIKRLTQLLTETQTRVEKAEQASERLVGSLTELHEYKVGPSGQPAWEELADFTVRTARLLLEMEVAILLRWESASSMFRTISGHGLSPQNLVNLKVRPGEGLLGKAAQGGKIVSSQEAPGNAALPHESFIDRPYLILPIWLQAQVGGLLVFVRPKDGSIRADTLRLATLITKQLQVMMENLDLFESRQRVFDEVVHALRTALQAKDPDSALHSEHTRALVWAMAQELHLPSMLVEQLEYGALLHDIGKIGVPQSVLVKEGSLNADELALVRKHPQIGFELLRPLHFMKGIAPIVLYHHERVNGQGYPEGLAGEEIPLGARLVAIVDAWDAMTTDQPYRKAMTRNNAVAELRQQAGTQFDPKLVDVFLRVVERNDRAGAKPAATA